MGSYSWQAGWSCAGGIRSVSGLDPSLAPDLPIGISPLGGTLRDWLDASSYYNGGGLRREPSGWVFSLGKPSWKQENKFTGCSWLTCCSCPSVYKQMLCALAVLEGKKQSMYEGSAQKLLFLRVSPKKNQILNKELASFLPLFQGYLLFVRWDLILISPVLHCCNWWTLKTKGRSVTTRSLMELCPHFAYDICSLSAKVYLGQDLKSVLAQVFSAEWFCVGPGKPISLAKLLAGKRSCSSPLLRD